MRTICQFLPPFSRQTFCQKLDRIKPLWSHIIQMIDAVGTIAVLPSSSRSGNCVVFGADRSEKVDFGL